MNAEPGPPAAPTPPAPLPARRPGSFDRLTRVLALLMLVVIFTVIYWIPLFLVPSPFAAPLVLAVLTLVAVNLASRVHRLRLRLDELEARAAQPPQK